MTNLQTTSTPPTIDAAKLRKWASALDAARVAAVYAHDKPALFQAVYGPLLNIATDIEVAADAVAAAEAAFDADMDAEFQRLFPELDENVPEVLPVQPRIDHPFGCECNDCTANVVLTEAARTGDACGIVRRK